MEKIGHHTQKPSLRASVRDAMGTSVMIGFGDNFLSTFAIFLRGTALQIGILATLPALVGALSQLLGVWVMDRFRKRRLLIVSGATLQALIWIPAALVPFVFGDGSQSVTILICLFILYQCFSNFVAPIWNSLIGDLIPDTTRGTFFGYRNRKSNLMTLIALVVGGTILEVSRIYGRTEYGFLTLFTLACLARLYAARQLSLHDDPTYASKAEDHFSFFQFLSRARHSNFAKFVFFVSALNFSVNVAGPYYAVYMLRYLHFSYAQFTIITGTTIATQFLTMQRWGALTDQFGAKKILTVSACGTALTPFLWLLSADFWAVLFIQMYTGVFWAGYNLASASFMFDAVSPAKRGRCAAYQNLLTYISIFTATYLGGTLVTHFGDIEFGLHTTWTPPSPLLILMFISGILRILTCFLFLPLFREVRDVDAIRHRDIIFRVTQIRPLSGASFAFFNRGHGKKEEAANLPPAPPPAPS